MKPEHWDDYLLLCKYFPAPYPGMMHEPYELFVEEQEGEMVAKVQESAAWSE